MTKRNIGWRALALAVACCSATASAQTAREAAVAIDAAPIPPADDPPLQVIAAGLRLPWSMAFLLDGSMLIVEKHAGVRRLDARGVLSPLLGGGPRQVLAREDSGYLDIALVLDDGATAQGRVSVLECPPELAVGERISARFAMGVMTSVTR